MNKDIIDLDDDAVEDTTTVVRIGVEGEAVTLRFDVVGMDECVEKQKSYGL